MSSLSKPVSDDPLALTEPLALAIAVQLADDFSYLLSKFGKKFNLTSRNIQYAELFRKDLGNNVNAQKMFDSILRNYKTQVEFLNSRKYGYGDQEAS